MNDHFVNKIVFGLERLSESLKTLLWLKAKQHDISPIQIQILIFIKNHNTQLCNVSHLANEFDVTKATISDAVRVLFEKELIHKNYDLNDKRKFTISLNDDGLALLDSIEDYSHALKDSISNLNKHDQQSFFKNITNVIYQLNKSEVISTLRICYRCQYYNKDESEQYCTFLKTLLHDDDIRIDCHDFIKTD